MTAIAFGGATPILRVRDLAASVTYYTTALGFQEDWQEPGLFASVSRDRCTLVLCEGDQGYPGAWAWIGVNDLDTLHAQYQVSGALIRQGPTNFSWACEIQVADPDGNVLRFGSDPKPGQPFGPWLDMNGVTSDRNPDTVGAAVARFAFSISTLQAGRVRQHELAYELVLPSQAVLADCQRPSVKRLGLRRPQCEVVSRTDAGQESVGDKVRCPRSQKANLRGNVLSVGSSSRRTTWIKGCCCRHRYTTGCRRGVWRGSSP